ncbi:hypothetical protein MMC18_000519 [Xylographa bjoerkii]|nr:hypothetical protein [Xylographa bjoerkii]
MASISSCAHSPSGSIATAAITASSETATSLDASDAGKDNHTCIDGITINAKTILSDPKPVYPVSLRNLREQGPTINVFVGQKPYLDLVFPISKALLEYFSPALRPALQSHVGNKYVVLHNSEKKAVSWVLRWMLSGGVDKTYVNAGIEGDLVDCLSKRLQIVVALGIQGGLQYHMYEELKKTLLRGAVSINQLSWIFAVESPPYTKALGRNLSFVVVDAVLSGEMTTIIPSVRSNPIFSAQVAAALLVRKGRLYAKQHHDWEPLTPFQLGFIYAFTEKGHKIRNMVVHDLIRLHRWQCIPDEQIYIYYAERNTDFNDDWERAEQENSEYRAKKLQERAATTAHQQFKTAPKKLEKKPQRRLNPANKKYNAYPAAAQNSPSPLLENLSAHDHTTPQADKFQTTFVTTRHRIRQGGKILGLSSKSGSMVPLIVNNVAEKTFGIKAREDIADDQKTQQTLSSSATLSITPPPGKRIESDAVLRLTAGGKVERER